MSVVFPSPRLPAHAGLSVLHVDDSEADRYRRRRALQLAGFHVADVGTGAAAVAQFEVAAPDILLLDVALPDMSGFDLTREFKTRAAAHQRDVMVVLISAYFTDSHFRVEGLQAGADAYLIEPLSDAELVATIAAMGRVLRTLQQARENERLLREANAAKNDFLASVAHELRQPIQAAIAAVGLMKARAGKEAGERAREVVNRQLWQMERITEDLLDAARIVRGQTALDRRAVDVCEAVRAALETLRPAIAQGQHDLAVHLPDAAVTVSGDAARLQQVLVNLVSNAVRYTPPGGRITVRLECDDGEASVRVADSGVGIATEQLPRIFEMFTRGEGAPRGGFGIGLAVARTIVEQHGGSIEARSAGPGKGSEFIIRLPRPPEAE
jgi:signal transduction histidine kinase